MPDTTEQTNALIAWLSSHGVVLAIAAIVLFIIYRIARPAIHRILVGVFRAQANALGADPQLVGQTDKRVSTLEDVLARLLKVGVFVALIIVILGVFDLWPLLAGLGLALAAITLAGQSIVLDYLMGLLILLEGQYFKGDVVKIGDVQGTVSEVGFRRTVVIDNRGTVNSISNGTIRQSANLTRTGAIATVTVDGIADVDVERTIEVIDAVGRQLSEDPVFGPEFVDVPGLQRDPDPHLAGCDPPIQRPSPAGSPAGRRGRDAPSTGDRDGGGRDPAAPAGPAVMERKERPPWAA